MDLLADIHDYSMRVRFVLAVWLQHVQYKCSRGGKFDNMVCTQIVRFSLNVFCHKITLLEKNVTSKLWFLIPNLNL